MEKVTTADLMDDLRKVVQDTEALLRATEGQVGEKADDARRNVFGPVVKSKSYRVPLPRWVRKRSRPPRPTSARIPGNRSVSRPASAWCWAS